MRGLDFSRYDIRYLRAEAFLARLRQIAAADRSSLRGQRWRGALVHYQLGNGLSGQQSSGGVTEHE
jgi:hypothetical protein